MKRRKFLEQLSGVVAFGLLFSQCKAKSKRMGGKIVGASAPIGHLLRDGISGVPVSTIEKDVVIIGGGISGLSAARGLQKAGQSDFLLLDLEDHVGGNASSGSNGVSQFPWGAHYVSLPNNSLTEYQEFLTEEGSITGRTQDGLPVYNELHLCFEPQERLFINGQWQEGLVPSAGVPESEKRELQTFFRLMEEYKAARGEDGKEAFAIPISASSADIVYTGLDRITMKEWLQSRQLNSSYLHWYINYCTRDDYGTPIDKVSAWAGIHYFASRRGKGENAGHGDVLTWPEGNGWLVKKMSDGFRDKILPGALAVSVELQNESVVVQYFDVKSKELKQVKAKQCVLAVPQFVAARLLKDKRRQEEVQQHFHYMPWMVANFSVKKLEERPGVASCWDNVIYDSHSLGYVVATHQLLGQNESTRNFTYYLPLTSDTPVRERRAAQERPHSEWVAQIVQDLKHVHPNIEAAVDNIDVLIWGHAMVQPLPGMIHGPVRQRLSRSVENKIHFAHTDLAGVSIFEEAFYQGLVASNKVVAQLSSV